MRQSSDRCGASIRPNSGLPTRSFTPEKMALYGLPRTSYRAGRGAREGYVEGYPPFSAINKHAITICYTPHTRTCWSSVASTSATRPCATGGTGSVSCLPRRSASAGIIIIVIRSDAGTLMRCSCGSTGRAAICGARLTTQAKCSRSWPRNGGIAGLRLSFRGVR